MSNKCVVKSQASHLTIGTGGLYEKENFMIAFSHELNTRALFNFFLPASRGKRKIQSKRVFSTPV